MRNSQSACTAINNFFNVSVYVFEQLRSGLFLVAGKIGTSEKLSYMNYTDNLQIIYRQLTVAQWLPPTRRTFSKREWLRQAAFIRLFEEGHLKEGYVLLK